jgi:hypothetical protein
MSAALQQPLFVEPPFPIGSRWSVRRHKGHNVWQVVSVNGSDIGLRCVSAVEGVDVHVAGDCIEVEPAWFAVRGALAAGTSGVVRRSA